MLLITSHNAFSDLLSISIIRGEKMAQETKNESKNEYNFLIYKYDTYGTYGQHEKIIKLIIDIDSKSQKALWEVISNIKKKKIL